jgi:acyl carrier protein phosphodiesterase
MNYLAHLHLSADHPQIELGNFIGDRVRKTMRSSYSQEVLWGVDLHHAIDSYTDSHPLTQEAIALFRPSFRLYSGVIVDIIFDYLLGTHWNRFHSLNLTKFSDRSSSRLRDQFHLIPERMQRMAQWLIENTIFERYGTLSGMEGALRGMSRRSKFNPELERAVEIYHLHSSELEQLFLEFYPQLITEAELCLNRLKSS